jgi:hypothetical protein
MKRLGYTRYVAQGGDVGASITNALGSAAPAGLLGIQSSSTRQTFGGDIP